MSASLRLPGDSPARNRALDDLPSVALQPFCYHPHIHYLVTGGGLWRQPEPGFLAPEAAIANLLRARFRDAMRRLAPEAFAAIPETAWTVGWVVHIKSVGDGGKGTATLDSPLTPPGMQGRIERSQVAELPRNAAGRPAHSVRNLDN